MFGFELAAFLVAVGSLAILYPQGVRSTARLGTPAARRLAESPAYLRLLRLTGAVMAGAGLGIAGALLFR
jgi:hypothetical protein